MTAILIDYCRFYKLAISAVALLNQEEILSPEKRITKAQIKQDKLVITALKASEYVQKNKKYFILGGGGVLAVVVILFLVSYLSKKSAADSAELFGKAQLSMAMGQTAMAIADYTTLVNDYGSTDAAGMACYLLGDLYLRQKNFDSAAVYYQKYCDKYGKNKMLLAASYAGLAVALESKSNFAQAGENYLKAAEIIDDETLSPEYLASAGRTFARASLFDKARKAYQIIIDKYNRSQYFSVAKRKLAEIEYTN